MLIVPKVNPNVTVTLNIGLGESIAWGKYKKENAEHGPVQSLVDILDTPHRVARILERIQGMAYNPNHHHGPHLPHNSYGIDYGHHVLPNVNWRTVQVGNEMTLVVKFEAVARDIIGQVFYLAEELKQDCIAVWIHNDTNGGIGQLIGRYNYVWSGGYFNPEYFVHLEV